MARNAGDKVTKNKWEFKFSFDDVAGAQVPVVLVLDHLDKVVIMR